MKYFKTYEGFKKDYMKKIDLKDFKKIKKGSKIMYMGGEAEVLDNNGFVLKLKGEDGKTFTVNKSMFDHGGMIKENLGKTLKKAYMAFKKHFKKSVFNSGPSKRFNIVPPTDADYETAEEWVKTNGKKGDMIRMIGVDEVLGKIHINYGKLVNDMGTDVSIDRPLGNDKSPTAYTEFKEGIVNDLKKLGDEINYLVDADDDTKKIWKKAGVNTEDDDNVILYSYVSSSWPETKKLLDRKRVKYKELEDPNSAGESYIVFKESLNEAVYIPSNIEEFAKRRGALPLVKKIARWAEKNDKRIVGGTAIGKNYDTLILDLRHHGGEIRVNLNTDEVTLNDMPIKDPRSFKKALDESITEAKFNKRKLMRAMKKDDGFIQLSNGQEYVIYNPNNNNSDNTDMWQDDVIFALDQDGEEHEIKYSDIVSYNESRKIDLRADHLSSEEYQKAKKLKVFDKKDWEWNSKSGLYDRVNEMSSEKDGTEASDGKRKHEDYLEEDVEKMWKKTYGENFASKYPGVAKILKQRKVKDPREIARIWQETYGEDFKEEYPAMWDMLSK